MGSLPLKFYMCCREDVTNATTRRTRKANTACSLENKQEQKGRLPVRADMLFYDGVGFSDQNFAKLSEAWQNAMFFVTAWFHHGWDWFSTVSLWAANRANKAISIFSAPNLNLMGNHDSFNLSIRTNVVSKSW